MSVKIHSVIDVITNSSTEMFTFMDDCVEPVKELIEVIGKSMGVEANADDMFEISVLPEDDSWLRDYASDEYNFDANYPVSQRMLEIEQSYSGEITPPEWLKQFTKKFCDYKSGEASTGTVLAFYIKDSKYAEIGEAIQKVLGSIKSEECAC